MQVDKTDRFFAELEMIIDFIAQNSFKRAEQFSSDLNNQMMNLPHFPYKCRQSSRSKDNDLRELVANGYVIPYRINTAKDRIEILGIFSENEWNL
ncbi:MAG: type II toxin-antitoxin system RelE/ParE family toxin [Sulfuricurvum sp.]|jgi:plasmid stabilization system protein ParE|uniref:type II toxin-antitoxin system RelE/ParE family toxin n=1 Tax=Sulfuricurvum sp. TaxID=2025608 RepID=UPI0025D7330D|nr:type II toxin-antitoxin system RelE/ParE family toxin [Sulfuricurvum sp.]MCK9371770.1 type II toxin-antitoxin system RelE/ParE family toxin [Sulfuricurvum sp.]